MAMLRNRRLFVTGATGFIGQALVRELIPVGHEIVLLTRDMQRVPGDFRGHTQIRQGNLANPASYSDALVGCAAVVHCAKSDNPSPELRAREDIKGANALLEASIRAGVQKFLLISTVSVYGVTPNRVVDESLPQTANGDHYARAKIQIEKAALEKQHEIEVVILRPANVYGPGLCWWSHTLINMMRRGKFLLVNSGTGLANMVHVSDLVSAIKSALYSDEISGECFLITDGRPIFWRNYFQGLEAIVGREATISVSLEEARKLSRKLNKKSTPARIQRLFRRRLLGDPVIFPLSDDSIYKFASQTVFSIKKAEKFLRYQPLYDLTRGLETVRTFELHGRDFARPANRQLA